MSDGGGPQRDLREFLTSRRARVSPEASGLPNWGTRRRVSGLRREEVALLAGISTEYYTRLERGQVGALSPAVLNGIATALQLDQVERDHFTVLIEEAASARYRTEVAIPDEVPASIHHALDALTEAAAFVRNERLDVLAINRLGASLYEPLLRRDDNRRNLARFVFLDPASHDFYRDWDAIGLDAAGTLRALQSRARSDAQLSALVDELNERSEEFRAHWRRHDVRSYRSGRQPFHHPVVGDLELDYDAFESPATPGLVVVVYTAPDDAAREKLLATAT
ncbi:helix-turn-helix transcriptional regulator [Humibacter ginsengisoli]